MAPGPTAPVGVRGTEVPVLKMAVGCQPTATAAPRPPPATSMTEVWKAGSVHGGPVGEAEEYVLPERSLRQGSGSIRSVS